MAVYDLIESSDAYSKTSGSLYQYYRDEPATINNGDIIDFPENNNKRNSLKFKQQKQDKQETVRCLNNGSIKISR